MNILLIAGGWSEERAVSLDGALVIAEALRKLGHTVSMYDPEHNLDGLFDAARGQDFAFINLHGSPGEDGLPQSMLDSMGLPYQGSRPSGSFLALNKAAAKAVYKNNKLPTAPWERLLKHPGPDWAPAFDYPIFIKGNTGGSSLALEKVRNRAELAPALARLFAKNSDFIVEPECRGQEVTCGVLGELMEQDGILVEVPRALPPVLIRPLLGDGGLFDYQSKYAMGGAEEICPAPLMPEITARVREYALAAHKALGLQGYSRTDFICLPDTGMVLLETNTLPGMTATSLVPREAAAIGLSFEQLIQRLIDLGMAAAKNRAMPQ